jgi:hypothetical protein
MREEKQHFAKYTFSNDSFKKDGHTMFIQDVVCDLNRKSFLESEIVNKISSFV